MVRLDDFKYGKEPLSVRPIKANVASRLVCLLAVIALTALGVPRASSAEPTLFQNQGNWGIFYDTSQDAGFCYATAGYANGTDVLLALAGEAAEWRMIFSNTAWTSIVKNQEYELVYSFAGGARWNVTAYGLDKGLFSLDLQPELIEDFAKARSLDVSVSGRQVFVASLRGTRAAVDTVLRCHQQRVAQRDPFANLDPFAEKQEPRIAEGYFTFSGRSVLSKDGVIHVTLGDELSLEELSARFPDHWVVRNFEDIGESGDILVMDRNQAQLLNLFYAHGTKKIDRVLSYAAGTEGPNGELVGRPVSDFPIQMRCDFGLVTTCNIIPPENAVGSWARYTSYIFEPEHCVESEFNDFFTDETLSTIAPCETLSGLLLDGYEPPDEPEQTMLPYGSRVGQVMTVVNYENLGSDDAYIVLRKTEQNAEEFCEKYVQDPSDECIEATLKDYSQDVTVSGNCESGDFAWTVGDASTEYRFLGRRTETLQAEEPSQGSYIVQRKQSDGGFETLGDCGACGYYVALNSFSALCPNRNVERGR